MIIMIRIINIITKICHHTQIQITVVLTTLCSPTPTTNLLTLLPAGQLRENVQFYVTCIGKKKREKEEVKELLLSLLLLLHFVATLNASS